MKSIILVSVLAVLFACNSKENQSAASKNGLQVKKIVPTWNTIASISYNSDRFANKISSTFEYLTDEDGNKSDTHAKLTLRGLSKKCDYRLRIKYEDGNGVLKSSYYRANKDYIFLSYVGDLSNLPGLMAHSIIFDSSKNPMRINDLIEDKYISDDFLVEDGEIKKFGLGFSIFEPLGFNSTDLTNDSYALEVVTESSDDITYGSLSYYYRSNRYKFKEKTEISLQEICGELEEKQDIPTKSPSKN